MIHNTELQRKISLSDLNIDDIREIVRIFDILTDEKKVDVLDRWNSIIIDIKRHREQMEEEKKILLIRAIEDIESDLEAYGRTLVQTGSKKDIDTLKFQI